jgi:hypothetical protein
MSHESSKDVLRALFFVTTVTKAHYTGYRSRLPVVSCQLLAVTAIDAQAPTWQVVLLPGRNVISNKSHVTWPLTLLFKPCCRLVAEAAI